VGWACHQPWSDGRIGLYGFSASAIAVYNAMHLSLPCVKGVALMAGTVDLYRDLLYIGGIPAAVPGAYVFAAVAEPWLQNFPGRSRPPFRTVPRGMPPRPPRFWATRPKMRSGATARSRATAITFRFLPIPASTTSSRAAHSWPTARRVALAVTCWSWARTTAFRRGPAVLSRNTPGGSTTTYAE